MKHRSVVVCGFSALRVQRSNVHTSLILYTSNGHIIREQDLRILLIAVHSIHETNTLNVQTVNSSDGGSHVLFDGRRMLCVCGKVSTIFVLDGDGFDGGCGGGCHVRIRCACRAQALCGSVPPTNLHTPASSSISSRNCALAWLRV